MNRLLKQSRYFATNLYFYIINYAIYSERNVYFTTADVLNYVTLFLILPFLVLVTRRTYNLKLLTVFFLGGEYIFLK